MSNYVHGIITIEKSGIVVETPNLGVSTNENPKTNANSWGGDVRCETCET